MYMQISLAVGDSFTFTQIKAENISTCHIHLLLCNEMQFCEIIVVKGKCIELGIFLNAQKYSSILTSQ